MYAQMSLLEFQQAFSSEEACVEYLFEKRWADGFRCARCDYDGYYFLKTTNRGQHWELVGVEYTSTDKFQFINDSIAYFLGHNDSSYLCKTVDSLNNWTQILNLHKIHSYQFINADLGYLLGGSNEHPYFLLKSTNGGITWNNLHNFDFSNFDFLNFYFNEIDIAFKYWAYVIFSYTFEFGIDSFGKAYCTHII